jgi:SAM-dependent methyltransferase
MDLDAVKARARVIWALGDYRKISGLLAPGAEALVEVLGIGPGQRVLDIAAGTGNVALLAARRGAIVTASDLTPRMLELGQARAQAERAEGIESVESIEWIEADAEDLPFPDASFDIVTSAFGAMFAPQPDVVVAEAARVLRPGGLLGMVNWVYDGYMARASAVTRRWWPRPAGLPDPYTWGDEPTVRARLDASFEHVACQPGSIRWEFDSPKAHRSLLETFSPSHSGARDVIGAEAAMAMLDACEALSAEYAGPDGSVRIDAAYLLVVARRRSRPPASDESPG